MARRSLTHVGGAAATWGDRKSADALAHALSVLGAEEGGEEAARAHVHGFHTYPARLHPDTAARLVRAFSPEAGNVLDPFCGSGTVLAEALLAGRAAVGTDLNPLAVLLARVKTTPLSEDEGALVLEAARGVAESADARRRARAGATRRLSPDDLSLFDPHVVLELDGVRAAIEALPAGPIKESLLVVLGALLVKVSRKRGDTAGGETQKRIASGFVIRFFVKKTEELVARRRAFTQALPPSVPRVRVSEDDATELRSVGASTVDCIVTSPPYAATYDYLEHHALRLRWLGLDAKRLAKSEMGARRSYARLDLDGARDKWIGELARFLRAAARVTRIGASVVLVVADSAVRGPRGSAFALRADEMVGDAMEKLPFEPGARASQARPHFHGPTAAAFDRAPRREHALLLRRVRG